VEAAEDLAADPAPVAAAGPVLAAVAAGGLAPTAAADHALAPSLVPNPAADPGPAAVTVEAANQRAGPPHPTVSTAAPTGKTTIRFDLSHYLHLFKTIFEALLFSF